MHYDTAIRVKFAGIIFSVMTLTAWGMWRLMMVE